MLLDCDDHIGPQSLANSEPNAFHGFEHAANTMSPTLVYSVQDASIWLVMTILDRKLSQITNTMPYMEMIMSPTLAYSVALAGAAVTTFDRKVLQITIKMPFMEIDMPPTHVYSV